MPQWNLEPVTSVDFRVLKKIIRAANPLMFLSSAKILAWQSKYGDAHMLPKILKFL